MADDNRLSILHVVVVGFHHKKGYQVEYSYPPFSSDPTVETNELPEEWKNLPSLALPDGSHNFTEDTVYFHLPSRIDSYKTVYCVSCYRQIDAKALLSKGADVTRNSVQKSVCVLSNLPLYGLIKAKLELVTHAYFDELDFSQVSLLKETYDNLCAMLTDSLVSSSQVFIGLSCRKLVRKYYHQVLILFKLLLLEKKVLFYGTPVHPICDGILSLLSLFPGMVERGLEECLDTSRPSDMASSTLTVRSAGSGLDEYLEVHFHSARVEEGREVAEASAEFVAPPSPSGKYPTSGGSPVAKTFPPITTITTAPEKNGNGDNGARHAAEVSNDLSAYSGAGEGGGKAKRQRDGDDDDLLGSDDESGWLAEDRLHLAIESNTTSPVRGTKRGNKDDAADEAPGSPGLRTIKDMVTSLVWPGAKTGGGGGMAEESDAVVPAPSPTHVATDATGLPLSIFTKGVICQPYMSLQYVDLLSNANVRGFVVGVTNSLFLSRKNLVDVVVEVAEGKIQIADGDLKKLVTLTTADLRFVDDIVQHVSEESGDIFLEDTEWEGGDEWIRAQFRAYTMSLLATVQSNDAKLLEDFGSAFVAAWRLSNNYRLWQSQGPIDLREVKVGHVCQGQLGVSDLKLRVAHTLQSSEKGRKINTAVTQTGKMAAQTGKVVGDAITNAKSAVTKTVTSWLGGFGGVFGAKGGVAVATAATAVAQSPEDDEAVVVLESSAEDSNTTRETCESDGMEDRSSHRVPPSESVQSVESLLDLK